MHPKCVNWHSNREWRSICADTVFVEFGLLESWSLVELIIIHFDIDHSAMRWKNYEKGPCEIIKYTS